MLDQQQELGTEALTPQLEAAPTSPVFLAMVPGDRRTAKGVLQPRKARVSAW